jgi:hypothetical protein
MAAKLFFVDLHSKLVSTNGPPSLGQATFWVARGIEPFFLHIYFERETPPSTVDFVLEKMNKTELMVVVTS